MHPKENAKTIGNYNVLFLVQATAHMYTETIYKYVSLQKKKKKRN